MFNSIFFKVLSSWEVIAAIVGFMIILPITFYITSNSKNETLKLIGVRRKKKRQKAKSLEKRKGETDKGSSDSEENIRRNVQDDDGREMEDNDRSTYEVLKKLKEKRKKR